MSVKTVKINLLPVSKKNEVIFLGQRVLTYLGPANQIIDKFGKNYDHDSPWKKVYLEDVRYYLYRVRIGAIGRINTCEDAILIGLMPKVPAKSHHFTSMALYHVFRMARKELSTYDVLRTLDKWLNTLLTGEHPTNTHYMRYCYGQDPAELISGI